MKAHANKHGGLHPNDYYNRAVDHIKTGTKIKFRHDGQNKVAYVTKKYTTEKGKSFYTLTSTIRGNKMILTHIEEGVDLQYLSNLGITLSKVDKKVKTNESSSLS